MRLTLLGISLALILLHAPSVALENLVPNPSIEAVSLSRTKLDTLRDFVSSRSATGPDVAWECEDTNLARFQFIGDERNYL
jgi:hypothetical protein